MKIGKYYYSVWTVGVRGGGVLVRRADGKCLMAYLNLILSTH